MVPIQAKELDGLETLFKEKQQILMLEKNLKNTGNSLSSTKKCLKAYTI
jgi:hypothetical protein